MYKTGRHHYATRAVFFTGLLLFACFFPLRGKAAVPAPIGQAEAGPHSFVVPDISWTEPAQGLELGLAELPESKAKKNGAVFVILRINPVRHKFSLHMASEHGTARSLSDWSQAGNLRAGINASMYLPDNATSTGYMRSGDKVNNGNIGSRLGAFFVASPRKKGIKAADILEHDVEGWRDKLEQYGIVVQNYRLISSQGRILWPEGGPEHSTAVVATDNKGRILFILSQEPLSPRRFAQYVKSFPLGLKAVMYVEGGAQAGLFVRLDDPDPGKAAGSRKTFAGASAVPVPGGTVHVWKGRQNLLNMPGNPQAVLPNIIGILR